MVIKSLVLLCVLCYLSPVTAADLLREQQIATRLEAALKAGEPLRLGGEGFLGIHTPASKSPTRGGVILLHERGMHPDWPQVIRPLRSGLPAHGWETLALQMPLAPPGAPDWADQLLIQEAGPRIAAGLGLLRQRGVDSIVLIGHGLGARMAIAYLQGKDADDIRALVTIGLTLPSVGSDDPLFAALRESAIPVLDIYGGRDSDRALQSARFRSTAIGGAASDRYRQDRVTGADHFFTGLDGTLLVRVRSWLARFVTQD